MGQYSEFWKENIKLFKQSFIDPLEAKAQNYSVADLSTLGQELSYNNERLQLFAGKIRSRPNFPIYVDLADEITKNKKFTQGLLGQLTIQIEKNEVKFE